MLIISSHRFPNLGILHVTRKKVVDVLVERFTQQLLLQEKRSESAVTGEQPQLSDGVCVNARTRV